ncbi:MAG: hypothetical protein HY020_26330 [Burkholderiales bacterium]|nr:hypothetical protein [Burkholderiales bacterium]
MDAVVPPARPLGDALFSANWYRVATLKPRLRGHVRIHRHVYRGEIWYVVEDRVSGKYHRFNPSSYRVIGLLDGERTLQQVWDRLSAAMDEHTPSQDELVQLFGQLYAADLIQCDVTPDVAELFERGGKQRRSKMLQRFANPVSLRFPLVDPDAWLGRVIAAAGPLKGWVGVALWLAVVLPAVLLAPSHWRELTGNINERLLAVDNLLLLAILFPLLKAAHEIGHGLAAKRFGGEVHEMGVMLLVFFPVPYVDASSSSAFGSRWPRMLVGAAGMLTELFIAAIAFYLWLALEPGFVRSLAFNVIVLASMTTLMFNANPLLRYDGYYIFADAIESPNLGQRASDYWGWLLRYHLFGQHQAEPPPSTPGERRWFLVYAPLALAYRLFVMFSIAVFIASRYFFVGVLIAAWGIVASVILPLGARLETAGRRPGAGAAGRPRAPRAVDIGRTGRAAAVRHPDAAPLGGDRRRLAQRQRGAAFAVGRLLLQAAGAAGHSGAGGPAGGRAGRPRTAGARGRTARPAGAGPGQARRRFRRHRHRPGAGGLAGRGGQARAGGAGVAGGRGRQADRAR